MAFDPKVYLGKILGRVGRKMPAGEEEVLRRILFSSKNRIDWDEATDIIVDVFPEVSMEIKQARECGHLESKLIRLAHDKPELRPYLLPLLDRKRRIEPPSSG